MRIQTTLRVARPTDHLGEIVRFYTEGLGLSRIDSFEDHDGFDGVMLGIPGSSYHLEFTRKRGHEAGPSPTKDNLLVFYLPDLNEWRDAVDRMIGTGYPPVAAFNPFWDQAGRTFQDADGYRVVLQNATWNAAPH
jgi:hypothetical protein